MRPNPIADDIILSYYKNISYVSVLIITIPSYETINVYDLKKNNFSLTVIKALCFPRMLELGGETSPKLLSVKAWRRDFKLKSLAEIAHSIYTHLKSPEQENIVKTIDYSL